MAWFNNDWKFRKKITVNSLEVDDSINFTLRIRIDGDGDLASHANSDGSDFVVTNINNNVLSHEIVKFEHSIGNAILNVRTNINKNIDTELYLYFGNENAIDTQNISDANRRFLIVADMDTNSLMYSTIPLTKGNTPTMIREGDSTKWQQEQILDWNESPVGYGVELENDDQLFDLGTYDLEDKTAITLQAWVKRADDKNYAIIGQSYDVNQINSDFELGFTNQKITAKLRTNTTASTLLSANTDVPVGTWNHVAWVWKANTNVLEFYLNGQLDGTHIVLGDNIQSYFGDAYPGVVKTIIGSIDGDVADVRVSTNKFYGSEEIIHSYRNISSPTFMTISDTEANELLYSGGVDVIWREDFSDWESRIKVAIKSSEFVGNEDLVNFPFLFNLYSPCLNDASPYGNDVIITDKYSEPIPFERFLYRQNVNQQRYAGAYGITLNGTAKIIQDTNADGNYRVGYLSGIGNSVTFNEVQIINQGTHNLKIRYSNGWAGQETVDILINGTDSYNVNLPSTGSWSIYAEVEIPINWTQEWNSIEFGKNSTSPDLDWIQPLGQETGQLKGFLLLPEVKVGIDTELYIYYNNPAAPIRINPPMMGGQPEVVIQAENMNIVSGYSTAETGLPFTNGSGLSLYPNAASSGEANTVFAASAGYYDVITEVIGENDGDNSFSMEINGVEFDSWVTRNLENNSFQRMHHAKQQVWLSIGDILTVKGSGNRTNTWGRIGQINLIPTVMDPNPTWNSHEVWDDYEGVWHLSETPGEGRPFFDSSGSERHLFSYGMNSGTNSIDSSIGAGIKFYNGNDVLYGQFDAMELSKQDYSMSMWIQREDTTRTVEGLVVSDELRFFFSNDDELKWDNTSIGHSEKVSSAALLDNTYFSKLTISFNSHTETQTFRHNGVELGAFFESHSGTGLNDNMAIGRHVLEDDTTAILTKNYRGDMAEIRIKKKQVSLFWDINEYKNLQVPQQYINYDLTECENNYKEFIIIDAGTDGSIYTDGSNIGQLSIERIQTVTTETGSEGNTLGSLHIERDSVGGVIVSGSDILTEFIITRESSVLISSQTNTIAGANWVIEFVRMFTGGILSGGASTEADEVSFVPIMGGSFSVRKIDTSHIINNGFTLDVYFEDAIGGRILSGGAIVNSVAMYTNIESGGMSWSSGPIVIHRRAFYIDNVANGLLETSGDLQNTHYVNYYDPSDNVLGLFSYPVEVLHTVDYNNSDYNGLMEFNGTVQSDNRNIFIPDTEVSGSVFTFGDIDTNLHIVNYYDPSDYSIGTVTGSITENNIVEFKDNVANGVIDIIGNYEWNIHYGDTNDIVMGTFSYLTEVVHTVEYDPIHLQFINLSKDVTADWILYDPNVYGSVKWGRVYASQEIADEWSLRITITDAFKGGVVLSGNDITAAVIVGFDPEVGIKTEILKTDTSQYVDYIGTYIENVIEVNVLEDVEVTGYGDSNEYAFIQTNVSHVEQIDFTPETFLTPMLMTGLAGHWYGYYPITNGVAQFTGNCVADVEYIPYTEGTITTTVISENRRISYTPELSGKFSVDLASSTEVVFNFIVPDVGIIETTGNSSSDSSVILLTANSAEINIFIPNYVDRVKYDNLEFNGKVKTISASAIRTFSTIYIPTNHCIMGRVTTLDNIPWPVDSNLWDIYYVEDNPVSNWYQYRPTGNFDPIANPLYNTGVIGVYNNVVDLPTVGNTVGDTWQIGPCHDGILYVWNGTSWEQDILYPATLIGNRESIGVLKVTGEVVGENGFTTDIEVSGSIEIIDQSITRANYNATVIPSYIFTGGGHGIGVHQFIAIETSLCEAVFSNENTIPEITRITEAAVLVKTVGSAIDKVVYENDEVLVKGVITGFVDEKSHYRPYVNKATLITPIGEVAEPNSVIFHIDSPTIGYISGSASVDEVIYKTSDFFITQIKVSDNTERFITYNESNDSAVMNITGEFNSFVGFEVFPNYLLETHGSAIIGKIEYKDIKIILVHTNDSPKEFETIYVPEAQGGVKWYRNHSMTFVVETAEVILSYQPFGRIKTSYYYLEPIVGYGEISIGEGHISTGGDSFSQIDFNNPTVEYGSILSSGHVDADKFIINEVTDEVTPISIINATENTVNYDDSNETAILLLSDVTAITTTYYHVPKDPGVIINSISDDTEFETEVEYFAPNSQRKIIVGGESEREVIRWMWANRIYVTSSISNDHIIIYTPLQTEPRIAISSGISSPNELHVIKGIVPASIELSGESVEHNIYTEEEKQVVINMSGTDIDNIVYEPPCDTAKMRTRIGIPPETAHYWEVLRESTPMVDINGGIPYDQSGQIYIFLISGGVNLTPVSVYEEESIFKFYVRYPVIETSGEAEYGETRDYVYDFVSGNIHVHGDYENPVEFYQTYTGYVNVYGAAICKLRYGHEVSVGTILVTLFNPTETEHSEYNKYVNDSNEAKVVFRRFTPVPYFTMPAFDGLEIVNTIIVVSNTETEYYPIFEPVAKVRLSTITKPVEYEAVYDHVATVEVDSVELTGSDHNYHLAYIPSTDVTVNASGDDITIDEFEAHYYPYGGGLIWSKGTITDPTDLGDYVNEDAGGTIELEGSVIGEIVKHWTYEVLYAHLGSIKIWSGADTHPEVIKPVIVEAIRVTLVETPNVVSFKYVVKRTILRTSGTAESITNRNGLVSGGIIVSGESDNISEYKYDSIEDKVNTSGTGLVQIHIERGTTGSIFINGIAGGNVIILPIVDGWLIFGGGVETADYVYYGDLTVETVKLIITGNMLYRTNVSSDLIFHELTHRREYEAGIEDDGLTTPEDTWSTLQNFNDLIEDTVEVV